VTPSRDSFDHPEGIIQNCPWNLNEIGRNRKMTQAAGAAARRDVQDAHLQDLWQFAEAYPKSEEAPEAIWQIATTLGFNGDAKRRPLS